MRLIPPRLGFARFGDPQGVLTDAMRAMSELAETRRDDGYFAVMGAFMGVIELLLKAVPVDEGVYEVRRTGQAPLNDPLILKVRAYLADHFHEPVSREQIARQVGASISTVERHYLVSMGEPLMKTVMRLRINRARELLATGCTVKEVGEATGFYDAFHFSKAFKRAVGISPSRFRSRGRTS